MTHPLTATFTEFAAIHGCVKSHVTALRKAGRLVLTDDGKRVRVAESLARIEATRDPAMAAVAARHAAQRGAELVRDEGAAIPAATSIPRGDMAGVDKIGSSYQAARAVKERYLAMAAKRDYEISIGKLLVADDVRFAVANAAATLRSDLENMPDSVASVLAAETDEARIRILLADEIEHVLGNLAARFSEIAKEAP